MKTLSTLVALGLVAVGAAVAQQDRKDVAGDPDKFFMVGVARMNLAEIAAGRLAEQRSQNDAVRKFGQQMVKDHSQANAELAQLARQKGVDLPAQADEAHAMMATHLSLLRGADFDQEYVTLMVAEHAKAVALFEAKSKAAKDADLKAWAGKTLKGLRHHLEMARELQEKMLVRE